MAKILTTAIVADIRNKLNGSVFSKNRYGGYVRTKVTPVNPQTTAQQNARNRLSANSQAWRGLTEDQRQAWIAAAANFPFTDIFGNAKILSGQALYVKLNTNASLVGGTPISDPPLPQALSAIESLTVTAADGTPAVSIAYSIPTATLNEKLAIFVTPMITPGRNFVKNEFRFLTSIAATATSPFNALSDYTALFGAPVADQKLFVRALIINSITGQAGTPLQAQTIVAV